jgi:hypothetical protein
MTKTPITLQDLRRRLYVKAKAEPTWRFWGLYGHVCKRETLRAAYELAKENDGAPGVDGVTFEAIEAESVDAFLDELREGLVQRRYRPQRPRKVGIPKEGGKFRQLSIPSIRDRVVQGALKLILEPIFEADFQPGVVWLPSEAVRARGGPTRLGGNRPGQDLRHRPRLAIVFRYGATSHRTRENRSSGVRRRGAVAPPIDSESVGPARRSARRRHFALAQ